MTKLTSQQITHSELADWTKLSSAAHAGFDTGDFANGAAFVAAITEAAEAANHHPDVTLTYPAVGIRLASHDEGGVTERDIALARTISEIASDRDIAASPHQVEEITIGLDTATSGALSPFWSSVLTGADDNAADDAVTDPASRVPELWFQHTDSAEPDRQRFHLDIYVHPDTLDARVAAATTAGGTVVDNSHYPSFVVLADADGNRACFCTHLDSTN